MKKFLSMMAITASVALVSSCGGSASEDESKSAGAASGASIGKLMNAAGSSYNAQYARVGSVIANKMAREIRTNEDACSFFSTEGIAEGDVACTTNACDIDGTSGSINVDISCKASDETIEETTCGETTYSAKAPTFSIKLSGSQSGMSFAMGFGASIKGGKVTDFTELSCSMEFNQSKMEGLASKLGESASEEDYANAISELVECEFGGKSIDMKIAMTEYKSVCEATR